MPLEICPQLGTVRCPLRRKPQCDDSESAACVFLKQVRASTATAVALMALELPSEIKTQLSETLVFLDKKEVL